ncbi:hypothetical protein TrVFT333_007884 [Trichoderma virens FT-333]|nr:hypothetical protein TrVFT333_007884 [Trichoderma virens FT-333]
MMAEQPSNSVKAAVSVKPTLLRKEYTPPKGLLSKIPASWVPYGELIRLHRPEFIYFIYAPFIVGLAYALCINKERVPAFTLAHRAGVLFVWTFFYVALAAHGTITSIKTLTVKRSVVETGPSLEVP